MKGDNYVYNEGNNDWLIWKYRYIGSIDFGMMIVYRNGDNSYYNSKCKSDDGTEFFWIRYHKYENILISFKNFKIMIL